MRAQVALLDGEHILLARHRRPDGDYWVLPGGSVEAGESPAEAAVREVREETGLEILVERLLFVEEPHVVGSVRTTSQRHTFLGRIIGGELYAVYEPDGGARAKGYLAGAEWRPFQSPDYDVSTEDTLHRVLDSLGRA